MAYRLSVWMLCLCCLGAAGLAQAKHVKGHRAPLPLEVPESEKSEPRRDDLRHSLQRPLDESNRSVRQLNARQKAELRQQTRQHLSESQQ